MRHLLAVAALVAAFVFLAPIASAHEWFTNSGCCDGTDCKPWVPTAETFEPVADGYYIRMSRQQLLQINPQSKCKYVNEFIPFGDKRIKASPVSSFGLCMKYDGTDGNCVRCLFIPGDI